MDEVSIFLAYLDIGEILRLDSAFCNHNSRLEWLNLLKTLTPRINVKNNQFAEKIADWLILKNVHPVELSLQYSDDSNFAISDDCVFKLTRNDSKLKELVIIGNFTPRTVISKVMFQYVEAHCIRLEILKLCYLDIPDNGLETLSNSCHQLKSIKFKH